MNNRMKVILIELKSHAPFTLVGAVTGVLCMFLFRGVNSATAEKLFYVFHPAHVLLSAMATAAMYLLYSKKKCIVTVLFVGVIGAIGVATLSDSVIPYLGEGLLGMRVAVHGHGASEGDVHEHDHAAVDDHEDESFVEKAHIGFIEAWYVVIPIAILGVVIAMFRPKTRFPHAGHVLLSTWASSFHILMAMGGELTVLQALGSFAFLFMAVWLPCCISDIIFPLAFVKSGDIQACCHHH